MRYEQWGPNTTPYDYGKGVLSWLSRYLHTLFDMHIITRKRLNDFARDHPDTRTALEHWYRNMKRRNFASLAEVRTVFPTSDKVGKLTVFNIGGNKVRLITAIHYNRHKVYIRAVLTHEEYDQNRWKE